MHAMPYQIYKVEDEFNVKHTDWFKIRLTNKYIMRPKTRSKIHY